MTQKYGKSKMPMLLSPPQAKLKQEEQARQSNRQEIVHSIAEADALTSELTDLLIEKVYVFPDNRIEIVYKVHDLFE